MAKDESFNHRRPVSPRVRRGQPDDLQAICRLFLRSLDTSLPGTPFSTHPDFGLEKTMHRMYPRLFPRHGKEVVTWVLEEGGTLAGFATIKYDDSVKVAGEADLPEIDLMSVSSAIGIMGECNVLSRFVDVSRPPDHGHSRGYGSLLMGHILVEAKAENREGLRLSVFKRNERAVSFYQKWKFSIVQEYMEEIPIGGREWSYLMECTLV
jgi:Acetyltransferase (GNAT) family